MSILKPDREKQNHDEDAGIQAEAWMALWKADDLISSDLSSLTLNVHDGNVSLTGHVVNTHHKQLAENLVKSVQV